MKFQSQLISSVAIIASLVRADDRDAKEQAMFLNYAAQQGKSYKSIDEFKMRLTNWKETDNFIRNYPTSTFTMAHNKFSDWTEQEKSMRLGKKNRRERKFHNQKELLESWWIFGECSPRQYKSIKGCEDCDPGCKMCSAKFFGFMGSVCDKCTDKTMNLSDGFCSCPDGISTSMDGESCCSENCTECVTLRNGAV